MNADAVNLVNGRGQCYLNIHNNGHRAQQQPAAFSQMISPASLDSDWWLGHCKHSFPLHHWKSLLSCLTVQLLLIKLNEN